MVPVFKNVGKGLLLKTADLNLVFQIVGRSHWWSLYLRMLGKGLLLKTTDLLVSKVFNKLVNNRIVDHVEKCGLFLFSVWF